MIEVSEQGSTWRLGLPGTMRPWVLEQRGNGSPLSDAAAADAGEVRDE